MDDYERKLKEEKLHRIKNEPHRYYVPIGKFETFINNAFSGWYICSFLGAANGIGKSLGMVNLLANLIWPVGNKWFQQDLLSNWPFPKKIRIVSDPTVVRGSIIPMMKQFFPKGRYDAKKYTTTKDGKSYESHWETDTGWTIQIMTYEQEPAEFEGVTLGLVWCDEPLPESLYTANLSRLRMGGLMIITATPLDQPWMYDKFVTNKDREAQKLYYLNAEVEDACKQHGVRGFLDHHVIEMLINQYPEDEREARAKGRFTHLSGLVFKMYETGTHLLRPFAINKRDYVVVEALDTHPRVAEHVTWMAIDRQQQKYIIDELALQGTIDELAFEIKKRESMYRIIDRIAEPALFNQDKRSEDGRSYAEKLSAVGITYRKASKNRQFAVKRTQDALSFVKRGDQYVKPPELSVFNTCTGHHHEFTHWQWENYRGRALYEKNPKPKPVDKDDHFMENVGRLLLEEYQFEEMVLQDTKDFLSEFAESVVNNSTDEFDPYE